MVLLKRHFKSEFVNSVVYYANYQYLCLTNSNAYEKNQTFFHRHYGAGDSC